MSFYVSGGNVHAPYCHLRLARLYSSFLHYYTKSTIFETKVIKHETCVLIIFTLLLCNILILRRTERDVIKKREIVFTSITRYYCRILMKLEFFRRIFERCPNVRFHENPSSWIRVVACERKAREINTHDEANSRF
jgi:hypothetical protein